MKTTASPLFSPHTTDLAEHLLRAGALLGTRPAACRPGGVLTCALTLHGTRATEPRLITALQSGGLRLLGGRARPEDLPDEQHLLGPDEHRHRPRPRPVQQLIVQYGPLEADRLQQHLRTRSVTRPGPWTRVHTAEAYAARVDLPWPDADTAPDAAQIAACVTLHPSEMAAAISLLDWARTCGVTLRPSDFRSHTLTYLSGHATWSAWRTLALHQTVRSVSPEMTLRPVERPRTSGRRSSRTTPAGQSP